MRTSIYYRVSITVLREVIARDLADLEDPRFAVDHEAIRIDLDKSQAILAEREASGRYYVAANQRRGGSGYGVRDNETGALVTGTNLRHRVAVRKAFEMNGTGSFSGDLTPILSEAMGWAADCGVAIYYPKMVVDYVARRYDGGLFGFVMDVKPLWD